MKSLLCIIKKDPNHEKTKLRQTQVVIVPFCEYFDSFKGFDRVIRAINLARQNAKDLVTDVSFEQRESVIKPWK